MAHQKIKSNQGATKFNSNDSDQDFDPSAEMLIHDFDDEHTLEEEEANDDCSNITNEISDLKKEGEMPLEELLALYGYEQSGNKVDKSAQEASSTSTNNINEEGENNVSLETNTGQDSSAGQSSMATFTLATSNTRSSKHLEELPHQWTLLSSSAPLINPNLMIDQDDSDMDDDDEEEDDDEDDDDDDDDEDGDEGADDWRRTIQVGSDYQAVIPDGLNGYGNVPPYENEDKLLWDAYALAEEVVVNFLKQIATMDMLAITGSSSPPNGTGGVNDSTSVPSITPVTPVLTSIDATNQPILTNIRDDEAALYLLCQCGHNVEEALRRKRMQQASPFESMSPWSEEECINFEDGIRIYGKDFHLIQKNKVSTRSVAELVQFYYFWKKTERHDMYASKWRVEKKKYALHPGTTDYMVRFIDEQENSAIQAHSMSSNYTRQQTHGSYSLLHYNHTSSSNVIPQPSNAPPAPTPAPVPPPSTTTTTTSSSTLPTSSSVPPSKDSTPESLDDSTEPNQSNGTGLSTTKSASTIPTSSTSSSLSISATTPTIIASSPSNSSSNETSTQNVALSSSTANEISTTVITPSGASRENVQNTPSNSSPLKTTSTPDSSLSSPSNKMKMNVVDR